MYKRQGVNEMTVSQTEERPVDQPSTHAMGQTKRVGGVPLFVVIFIIGLFIPLFIFLGPLRLSVYRLVLFLLFFPLLFRLLNGTAGRMRLPDFCVIGICVWSSISLIVIHGISPMVESIGILWIETLGAYLIGRVYIRTPETFHATVRLLFWLGMLILPFAVVEAVTSQNLLLELFGKIGPTLAHVSADMGGRLGLNRVQGPFDHPILFGVVIGGLVGLSYYVLGYGRAAISRILRALMIALTAAFSLSSGPMIAIMTQIYLIIWDGMFQSYRKRWYAITVLAILGFIVVDIISTRTPFHVIATYVAFSPQTAYGRLLIWSYGLQNILANPIFGLGFNDWQRAAWMTASIDMFWIVGAIRHGIVVWALWIILFFSVFLKVAFSKGLNARLQDYRTGYLVALFGLFLAGWTVHFWNASFAFFMFLLGSGLWMVESASDEMVDAEPDEGLRGVGYSRFPPRSMGRVETRLLARTLS